MAEDGRVKRESIYSRRPRRRDLQRQNPGPPAPQIPGHQGPWHWNADLKGAWAWNRGPVRQREDDRGHLWRNGKPKGLL